MSSLITNAAAMTALKSLQSTNAALESAQKNVATGLRVSEASDNAAYWSIATTMRSDNKALSTVQDALGLGAAKIDIAYTGMNSALETVNEIKSKLVAAREPGVDKNKINAELDELKGQLQSIAGSASFSGENWLLNSGTAAAGAKEIVGSFNRDSAGNVSVATIKIDASALTLVGSLKNELGLLTKRYDADASTATSYYRLIEANTPTTGTTAKVIEIDENTSDAVIDEMITTIEKISQVITDAAADLGSQKTRVDLQTDFVEELRNAIKRGVGKLVDADMTEESTKLQALQTQQQLGIQALSIANASSQSLLSLFRN